MKSLFAIVLLFCASLAWCATPVPAPSAVAAKPSNLKVISGEVLEVKDVESYTYMRLKTASGEVWSAVATAAVKKGDKVSIEDATQMDNFESKTLKKKFPVIFFGNLANPKLSPAAAAQVASAHAAAPKVEGVDAKVSKANGPDARSVSEMVSKVAELKDKNVVVHAKVVKYNGGIMGKNWLHLRDGSGAAADGSNDIAATTQEQLKVGDVVTLKGILRKDKDFGSGYTYKVLIEEAKLQK
jgi:membrane-associated protease RseP (regulator of RpoE activity)